MVGHKKKSLLGVFVDTQVCECEVCHVLCQHHVRHSGGLQCVFVIAFLFDWCRFGTYSCHNTGFQTIFHAAGLVRTKQHIVLTGREHGQSSAALASPPKEK